MTSIYDELFSVAGKVAVVTGGAKGIGAMIATALVRAGADVHVVSRSDDDGFVAGLAAQGRCSFHAHDLSTMAGVRAAAVAVQARTDRLHILVNNAGVFSPAPIEAADDAAWDRDIAVNLRAPFFLTQQLLPQLEAAATPGDPARVINVGSIDGIQVPALETYSYSASKAAVHQLTRHLAKRLGPSITVNAIAPGPFESQMMKATLEKFGDSIAASAPLKRIGRPDDMAGAAIYLASRAGSYLTGAVIPVDGGIATVG